MFSSKHKGRGATANMVPQRFNLPDREVDRDWLDERDAIDGPTPPVRTHVTIEKPKKILSHNSSPDIPFDQSINAYRGCEHGCVYCYARPTHAFHDLSPGLDFETRLFAKPNAPELLRAALRKKGYRASQIAMGTNTDPYQPIEGRYRITRDCLAILAETKHPVTITTKSDRVVRDIDYLADMASNNLVAVAISITSLDPKVHRTLEPRAPSARKRLAAVTALNEAGIPTYVSMSPIIPAITDHEIEHLIEAAADAGAHAGFYVPIRLPHEVSPLFRAWLDEYYPDRASKVMNMIQSLRDGRDNDPAFFNRMRGEGPWADLIRSRFRRACRKNGLNQRVITLRSDLFRPPPGRQGELAL